MNSFVKLKDVCIKITDGSHYSPVGIAAGIPMLSVKDMQHSNFNYSNCKFISRKDYEALVKADCKPLRHDVLIAKDGSYLKHVFVVNNEIDQAVLSSIGILRPDLKQLNPYYLKYYLHTASVKEIVSKKYVSGSALPRIILKNFGEIDILYKSLFTQQKIADVLSALDSKIELNNRINAELEAMAKTIYDYWFVQFDFPTPSPSGRAGVGSPYKSSGGKMVWCEELKREIPEGWEGKTIGKFANFVNGKGIDKELLSISGFYAVYGSNGKTGYTNEILFKEPVIAVGRVGANYGEVHYSLNPCWITDNAVTAQPLQAFYLWWLITTLKRIDYKKIAGGSAQPLITQGQLKELKFAVPKDILFKDFDAKVHPIYHQLNLNIAQNQKLTELRDWLLPMLMNGQVTVGKAYEQVEEMLGMVAESVTLYNNSIKGTN